MSSAIELGDELMSLLHSNDAGLSDEQISHHFGERYPQLVTIINDLLSVNRLQLFYQGETLVYKIVQAETAAKFDGLGYELKDYFSFLLSSSTTIFSRPEQILVYQVCERAGNR